MHVEFAHVHDINYSYPSTNLRNYVPTYRQSYYYYCHCYDCYHLTILQYGTTNIKTDTGNVTIAAAMTTAIKENDDDDDDGESRCLS